MPIIRILPSHRAVRGIYEYITRKDKTSSDYILLLVVLWTIQKKISRTWLTISKRIKMKGTVPIIM